jgi:hypothetical protein
MTVAVTMRGMLEPVLIEEGFIEATHALNMANAQGKEFILATTPEGDNIGMSMRNILFIKEIDE